MKQWLASACCLSMVLAANVVSAQGGEHIPGAAHPQDDGQMPYAGYAHNTGPLLTPPGETAAQYIKEAPFPDRGINYLYCTGNDNRLN
jgi:hypothetical protein